MEIIYCKINKIVKRFELFVVFVSLKILSTKLQIKIFCLNETEILTLILYNIQINYTLFQIKISVSQKYIRHKFITN